MLPVCFIHTLITQLWIYQWSLETSPKTHKLFFYGCMLPTTNTNQGWQRLFISVDRLFMTIFKSFAFVPSLFVDKIKAFEMPHLVKISLG